VAEFRRLNRLLHRILGSQAAGQRGLSLLFAAKLA